jgi:hypothetical protein
LKHSQDHHQLVSQSRPVHSSKPSIARKYGGANLACIITYIVFKIPQEIICHSFSHPKKKEKEKIIKK